MVDWSRRCVLSSIATGCVSIAAGCLSSEGDVAGIDDTEEWPSFRQGVQNTAYAKGEKDIGEPSVKWRFESDATIWGSPAVHDGAVFIASTDGTLYAIEADDGAERWRFETGNRIEGTPACVGATVFVGSYDRQLYALDVATGESRWEYETEALIRASPTVSDDMVYIPVGCHSLACAPFAEGLPERGWVHAVDVDDGKEAWTRDFNDEMVSTPAVADGTVYVGGADNNLYALDATSGETRWYYEARRDIWAAPSVASDTVYFADWAAHVYALDIAEREARWEFDTRGAYISGSTAVDDASVYVGTTPPNYPGDIEFDDAEVVAIDRESGDQRWSFETNAQEIGSSPVVTDEQLYIGSHAPLETDGTGIYALDADTGDQRWFFDVPGRGVGSSPALVDGTLYFGGESGTVFALE